jgi:deoxyadenosine/deoxycytidine kinase
VRRPDSTPTGDASRPSGGIVVVGPCGSGKTTLVVGLTGHGIAARQVAQEHSIVRDLWRLRAPSLLVYLDASYETCSLRKRFDWPRADYEEQGRRLEYARRECDIYVDTDGRSPQAVLDEVLRLMGKDPGT